MAKENEIIEVECGFYIERNGKRYFSPDITYNGFAYRDDKAFEEKSDNVCYIPEYGFEYVEPAFEIDGNEFYAQDDVDYETYASIVMKCQAWADNNPDEFKAMEYESVDDLAYDIFSNADWACIDTYLLELDY